MSGSPRARSRPAKSILWITDPWETLDHPRDTTLRLAQEAQRLGARNFWCDVRSIRWENGAVHLDARSLEINAADRRRSDFALGDARICDATGFQVLQYRTDPPVDLAYQQPLQLLRLATRKSRAPELVNPPEVLLLSNEKLEAAFLDGLMPPTAVASQWEPLRAFGTREGRTVLKPLNQAQSIGVELLDWRTTGGADRARGAILSATDGFRRPILLQRYLPGIENGELRLWFIDGKLLASVKKFPVQNDFRVNMDQGSRLGRHKLTAAEKEVAGRIGKFLRSRGVRLAAIDLIEDLVTDFNFTSPGLIPQMEETLGENLAGPIVRAFLR